LRINKLGKNKRFAFAISTKISQNELFRHLQKYLLGFVACEKNKVAHKLCNQEKSIETREVSSAQAKDFHKLINICVEILMLQKYFSFGSALSLPCGLRSDF